MRRLSRLAAAAGLIAALTGCDSPNRAHDVRLPPCAPHKTCHGVLGTDPAIVVYQGKHYSNLMPLLARLAWIEGESCLVAERLDEPGSTLRILIPIWPEGTRPVRAADGRRGVEASEVGQVLEGEVVRGGGSDYTTDLTPPIPQIPSFRQPPGACTTYDGFFVVSPGWGLP